MTISLSGASLQNEASPLYARLLAKAPLLAAKDATLWGREAEAEAAVRLNWIDLPVTSQALLPQIDDLVQWARSNNLTNVILAGMGGSSLAPEVISKTYKKALTVLDTTDPDQLMKAIPSSLTSTVVVVND